MNRAVRVTGRESNLHNCDSETCLAPVRYKVSGIYLCARCAKADALSILLNEKASDS